MSVHPNAHYSKWHSLSRDISAELSKALSKLFEFPTLEVNPKFEGNNLYKIIILDLYSKC